MLSHWVVLVLCCLGQLCAGKWYLSPVFSLAPLFVSLHFLFGWGYFVVFFFCVCDLFFWFFFFLLLPFLFFFFFFFSKLFPRTCVEKDFPILFCQLSLPDQSMKPQLAAPELATNNPTLTTVALEKPFCMFDSSLHPNKSYAIYLYVMKSSGKYQALFHL